MVAEGTTVEPLAGGIRAAHLGRPRTRATAGPSSVVRVELRMPRHVADLLFERADETGRTVSRVGADAIWEALSSAEGQM